MILYSIFLWPSSKVILIDIGFDSQLTVKSKYFIFENMHDTCNTYCIIHLSFLFYLHIQYLLFKNYPVDKSFIFGSINKFTKIIFYHLTRWLYFYLHAWYFSFIKITKLHIYLWSFIKNKQELWYKRRINMMNCIFCNILIKISIILSSCTHRRKSRSRNNWVVLGLSLQHWALSSANKIIYFLS